MLLSFCVGVEFAPVSVFIRLTSKPQRSAGVRNIHYVGQCHHCVAGVGHESVK